MEFVVLGKPDVAGRPDDGRGERSELLAADQREAAEAAGYTIFEFVVDAPTRRAARRAWDAHRGRQDERPPDPAEDNGLEELNDQERAAMVALVAALVQHDEAALVGAGAYEWPSEDPYLWTRQYGPWGQVDLMLPPGDPRHWSGGVYRGQGGPDIVSVDVDMWTAQEGPSDLTLEAELVSNGSGVVARFSNLHVM